MFAASSPAPKVELRRSYAATVGAAGPTSSGGRTLSRAAVAVGAVVVVGACVLVGRSALQRPSASHDDDAHVATSKATQSWWRQLLARLPLRRAADEDEDDAFASGSGAANLFDEDKKKARQAAKDRARAPSGASPSAAPAPRAAAATAVVAAAGSREAVADAQEREMHIKLVRALLHRKLGIEYDDESSSSSDDSDATDVSLNYHLASSMEVDARDKLLMAFADYEELSEGAVYGGGLSPEELDMAQSMEEDILVKMLEYLDMSNEREKLRHRRIAMYRQQGRATPVSSIDNGDGADEEGEGEEDGEDPVLAMLRRLAAQQRGNYSQDDYDDDDDDDDALPSAASRQARQFQALFGPTMMGVGDTQGSGHDAGDSVLDRILGQASGAAKASALPRPPPRRAAREVEDTDMMEDEWEDEDDEEEADFMAYLQQPDDAEHFYSRNEMRQARRDPVNDVRVVGLPDEEAEADGDDWGDHDNMDMMSGDEEDMMAPAEPWSRRDKAAFERELFARVQQLARTYSMTADMAERDVAEDDMRKEAAREARRQQRAVQKPKPASRHESAAPPPQPAAEADEEWEDEDDWEDDEEDAE